jgi:hypothetical protein
MCCVNTPGLKRKIMTTANWSSEGRTFGAHRGIAILKGVKNNEGFDPNCDSETRKGAEEMRGSPTF